MAAHQTSIEIDPSGPTELEVGADIALRVKVTCAEGCDLLGFPIKVTAASELLIARETEADLTVISLKAPAKVGEQTWTVVFPTHEVDGLVHEESALVVSFTTRPHTTSMAVWSVPSAVVVCGSFMVKVGVKCSASCSLAGRFIEVCDEAGVRIGEGRLGGTPWPGSSALYVADVELAAPATEGMVSWSARFAASESGLPHDEASALFGSRTVKPPEHLVTIKVTEKDTQSPVENAVVRLGVYRASTNAEGLASLALPTGVYALDAWKTGYEMIPLSVEVATDLMIQLKAVSCPTTNSDDSQVWM